MGILDTLGSIGSGALSGLGTAANAVGGAIDAVDPLYHSDHGGRAHFVDEPDIVKGDLAERSVDPVAPAP